MSRFLVADPPRKLEEGYWKKSYPEIFESSPGKGWVRKLPSWERKAFCEYGLKHIDRVEAGKERARLARRDDKGRFLPNE